MWCGVLAGEVVAWSAIAPFSHRAWYAGVGEYTVYVARRLPRARHRAARCSRALAEAAPSFGYWKLVGMILPENAAGLALAHGSGFHSSGNPPRARAARGRVARRHDRRAPPRGRVSAARPGRPRAHPVHRLPARRGRSSAGWRAARAAGALPDVVWLLEHPPVFTAGRHGRREDLFLDDAALAAMGATFVAVDRGGQMTWHGPGPERRLRDRRPARRTARAGVRGGARRGDGGRGGARRRGARRRRDGPLRRRAQARQRRHPREPAASPPTASR